MADVKISALTAITGANTASGDLIPIVDSSASETKSITRDELAAAVALGLQQSAIADLTLAYTANDPGFTPNNSVTFADGSSPTNAELLEAVDELASKLNAVLAHLRTQALIAT